MERIYRTNISKNSYILAFPPSFCPTTPSKNSTVRCRIKFCTQPKSKETQPKSKNEYGANFSYVEERQYCSTNRFAGLTFYLFSSHCRSTIFESSIIQCKNKFFTEPQTKNESGKEKLAYVMLTFLKSNSSILTPWDLELYLPTALLVLLSDEAHSWNHYSGDFGQHFTDV